MSMGDGIGTGAEDRKKSEVRSQRSEDRKKSEVRSRRSEVIRLRPTGYAATRRTEDNFGFRIADCGFEGLTIDD